MLPMSNTGKINATNGRQQQQQQQQQQCSNLISAGTTKTTINTNVKVIKKPTTTTTTTTIAAATSSIERKGKPTTTTTTATKLPDSSTINNEHSNKNEITTTSTISLKSQHNRADSNAKLQQQQQQDGHTTISLITSSSSSGSTTNNHNHNALQQQQQQQQQQHHLVNNSNRRDPHKYQYGRPQTLPPPLHLQQQQQQFGNNLITTTATTTSDECDGRDNYLVYYDNELISGKLESLIEHMVPTSDYYPQHNYVFAFLLSARLFLRPYELLAQISQTWEQQQQQQQQHQQQMTSTVTISHDVVDEAQKFTNLTTTTTTTTSASPLILRKANTTIGGTMDVMAVSGGDGGGSGVSIKRTSTQKTAQNCIRLLSEWIETFPYDFRDERLMQQVRILARKCIYIDTTLGKKVSQILQLLVQRLTALEKYEEFLQSLLTYNDQQQSSSSSSSSSSLSSSQQTFGGINSYAGSGGITTTNNITATATIGSLHNKILLQKQQQQQQQQQSVHHNQQQQQQHMGGFYNNYNNSSSSNNSNDHYQQQQQQHNHNQQHATLPAAINEVSSSTTTVLGIMDICPSCAQLAHQLTAIELERLSHIGPEEFVQAFAKEYQQSKNLKQQQQQHQQHSCGSTSVQQNNSNSFNDMKKTRNLESYVEWFNRLSYLTATEIVKYSKKKQRVRVIEYWIETARECFNIGNFNSLMAIIAGLNLAPISRLKKTWAKVQSAKFSVLEHQMDPTSNFNSYRSTLKAAMWRFEGATDERERIIIPFFSLFVKDLYFLNEGCSNRLPNNHINFEKCSHLAKQVMDFNEWKQVSCPFEKLPNVISFLQNSNVLNENTLSMASFECEPPENTEEKGRYKTVKAETKQQLLQQLQQQGQQH